MSQNVSRSKISLYNAATAMAMTLANGLLGIVVTRFIIASFGSDFNGLNSTANQIVNVLLVMEGGFTMASNVALFAPMTKGDYAIVNGVLAATRSKFRRLGFLFLMIGSFVAVGYGLGVNSDLPSGFITTVIIMAVTPAAFNLFYATTYRVLLQTQQKEYIINIITICTIGLGHLANIVMICMDGPMWMVRFNTMVFGLLNSVMIGAYVKRKAPFLNLKTPPIPEMIQGTNDVMVQKITGVIYNSAPIVFLTLSPAGGTVLASVYAVYNNVFVMLKSLLHGIIDAPRMSFGQILTERKREDVWPVFAQYEFAAFTAIFILLSTCCTLIMPFIGLYMDGITDADYSDIVIALFMVIISSVEMMHIPSGHLLNMAGEFKVSKDFQLISCVVLLVGMMIGGSLWGVYGMLGAILMVAVLLAVLEMGYIHTRFFRGRLPELMRLMLPLGVTGVILCAIERRMNIAVNSYLSFIAYGLLYVCLNAAVGLIVGFLFNRRELTTLLLRAKRILKRRTGDGHTSC